MFSRKFCMSPRRKCSCQRALRSCKYSGVNWFLWAATHRHSCKQYLWQLIVEIQVEFFLQPIPDVNLKIYFVLLRERKYIWQNNVLVKSSNQLAVVYNTIAFVSRHRDLLELNFTNYVLCFSHHPC